MNTETNTPVMQEAQQVLVMEEQKDEFFQAAEDIGFADESIPEYVEPEEKLN